MPRTAPRSYSDEEIASALAVVQSLGGNLLAASNQIGIPRKTLATWRDGTVNRVGKRPGVARLRQKAAGDLAAKCDQLAWKLADAMPRKIKDAPLSQVATSLAIVIDKARLLREQGPPPTEAQKTASEAIQRAADALVALSQGTVSPIDRAQAERMILGIQLVSARIEIEKVP